LLTWINQPMCLHTLKNLPALLPGKTALRGHLF
jgi:hypothetical protein